MSSFEDVETQNARRPQRNGDSAPKRRSVDGVHPTTSVYERAFREPTAAPLRRPRTALGFGLLPPVAP